METPAERLKDFLRRKNLTQSDLARQTKRKKSVISRIVTGKRPVGLKQIPIFSRVTGIPPRLLRPDIAELFFPARKKDRQRASSRAA